MGHQDGLDFFVLEYLEEETLTARLEKGPLAADQALRYAIQIADVLAKAHSKALTHRDLKPGNIVLTKAGAKLLDFGLAKAGTAVVGEMAAAMLSRQPPGLGSTWGRPG